MQTFVLDDLQMCTVDATFGTRDLLSWPKHVGYVTLELTKLYFCSWEWFLGERHGCVTRIISLISLKAKVVDERSRHIYIQDNTFSQKMNKLPEVISKRGLSLKLIGFKQTFAHITYTFVSSGVSWKIC